MKSYILYYTGNEVISEINQYLIQTLPMCEISILLTRQGIAVKSDT